MGCQPRATVYTRSYERINVVVFLWNTASAALALMRKQKRNGIGQASLSSPQM